jgi:hypothetical protein
VYKRYFKSYTQKYFQFEFIIFLEKDLFCATCYIASRSIIRQFQLVIISLSQLTKEPNKSTVLNPLETGTRLSTQ